MAGRILVIRGGAIGDFILTLPAIALLRESFPEAHLEILGYRHIATLAERSRYADAVRSIDYAPLARFFNPKSDLDPELSDYFASFQQVISYIYDPDGLFEASLRKAGVKNLIVGSPKVAESEHAAFQLAAPLQKLALWLDSPAALLDPAPEDRAQAEDLFGDYERPLIALHPGSGSETKNWPVPHWSALAENLLSKGFAGTFLLVGGESDGEQLTALDQSLPEERRIILENLPLPVLAAALSHCDIFIGHDTGISHLAAAVGARCLLLFGPTDPAIWAPANEGVQVIRSGDGRLASIPPGEVSEKLEEILADVR